MECAVLVLAAGAPEGLAGLARFFDGLPATLHVHVDGKVDAAPFLTATAGRPCVRHLAERRTIYWGGFSMVEATLALLRQAMRDSACERFLLVSDDAVPLLPRSRLLHALRASGEYIEAHPVTAAWVRRRYDGFYMFDSRATQARHLPPAEREVTSEDVARLLRLEALRRRGKKPLQQLRHGAQWWGITRAAAASVLYSYDNDSWMRESFEFSEVPDESYLQTLVGPRLGEMPARPLMRVDWSREPRPYVFRSLDELRGLDPHGALFARKVAMPAEALARYLDGLG